MAIYKGSRYERVPVYNHYFDSEGTKPYEVGAFNLSEVKPLMVSTLERRNLTNFPVREGMVHVFKEGDRIDLIANSYYSDPQMWWLIMDANPRYMTPWEIKVGDVLAIPPYIPEVMD